MLKDKYKIIFLDIDGVLNVMSQEFDDYGQLYNPIFVDDDEDMLPDALLCRKKYEYSTYAIPIAWCSVIAFGFLIYGIISGF